MTNTNHPAVEKLRTGISSLDIIAKGGLPRNRTTLISGTAGSGKTVFAVHFLAAGIEQGEPGVFVTFEESADDVRKNMRSFGRGRAARCERRLGKEVRAMWAAQHLGRKPFAMMSRLEIPVRSFSTAG